MKRLTQTLAFCLLTAFTAVAQKNYVSEVWISDLGNGKYKNPVLYADYSDPDACRVGDDFYMTSSSFNCLPGLQILHSKDLVNWTIIGAAVPNALTPIETPERPDHGNRIWAPAIRYHNGEFYIFWGDPDQGAFMVKAKDPKGCLLYILGPSQVWCASCPSNMIREGVVAFVASAFSSQIVITLFSPARLPAYACTIYTCLLYTSPSPRDRSVSRMPSSA